MHFCCIFLLCSMCVCLFKDGRFEVVGGGGGGGEGGGGGGGGDGGGGGGNWTTSTLHIHNITRNPHLSSSLSAIHHQI